MLPVKANGTGGQASEFVGWSGCLGPSCVKSASSMVRPWPFLSEPPLPWTMTLAAPGDFRFFSIPFVCSNTASNCDSNIEDQMERQTELVAIRVSREKKSCRLLELVHTQHLRDSRRRHLNFYVASAEPLEGQGRSNGEQDYCSIG